MSNFDWGDVIEPLFDVIPPKGGGCVVWIILIVLIVILFMYC